MSTENSGLLILNHKMSHVMIPYIENTKDPTQKLLNLINDLSKVAGYKINIQKSVACMCTNNEILEKKYKNTIPFKTAPPKKSNTWE